MMTQREVFDKVKEHLLTQKQPADDPFGSCYYRTPVSGTMCAIGCLIDDAYYNRYMEGENVYSTMVQDALVKSGVPFEKMGDMLTDLQDLHDDSPVSAWEERLNTIADKYFF